MKYLWLVLRIFLGAFFVFSALSKLYPIEPFEYTLIEHGLVGWGLAPYFARFIIVLEAFLGIALISGFRLRSFSLPVTAAMLLAFTVYLVLLFVREGNEASCGCFGAYLELSPLASIGKNILLILVTAGLFFFSKTPFLAFRKVWIALLLFVATGTTIFVLNMPDAYFLRNYNPKYETGTIDFNMLPHRFSDGTDAKLNEGKKLLCFFSVTCPHCKVLARKLSVFRKVNPLFPGYVFFYGDSSQVKTFSAETDFSMPYVFHNSPDFMRVIGGKVPAVFLVEDGKILHRYDRLNLNMEQLSQEFNTK